MAIIGLGAMGAFVSQLVGAHMSKKYTSARAAYAGAVIVDSIGKFLSRKNAARSLLLGSAAAVVVTVAANPAAAEDRKPVQYVKICTLYGDGFYYIPGSDTCIKLGGYVRADYGWNVAEPPHTPQYFGSGGAQDRTVSQYSTRHRANIQLDTRTQTAYGDLRSFTSVYYQSEGGTQVVILPRAFIQWAGFTFGRVKSSSDSAVLGDGGPINSLQHIPNLSDTTEYGNNEISYTWELGNGATFHLGGGERRVRPVANLSNVVWDPGSNPISSIAGQQFPNPFVAFKVSQAWGRFDVSVTGNPIHATYYTAAPGVPGYVPGAACAARPGTTSCDHPSDVWGWAAQTGVIINIPWIGPGDVFGAYGAYGVGASANAGGQFFDSPGLYGSGNNIALGALTDAVYLNGSGFQLTTAWTAGAAFTHWWTSNVSSTAFGAHTEVSYNDTVLNNRWFCGGGGAAVQSVGGPAAGSCNPNFGLTTIGTHTDWYPVPSFRLAVEVLYTKIDTAFDGATVSLTSKQGARPTGPYTAKDEGISSVVFRAQRQWPAVGRE